MAEHGESRAGTVTRRTFLAGVGVAALPGFVPSAVLGAGGGTPPSDRITMGIIGAGNRGTAHARAFMNQADAKIVAVCDANRPKADRIKAKLDKHYTDTACTIHSDFREIIDREDIDAVTIASPENWHALQASMAAAAGKDIYCEKALSLTVEEGRKLCDAVRRYGAVLQVGTQQRSGRNFRYACELARNGYLGALKRVEVGVPGGRALGNAPVAPVPPGLDYDLWLGPAPRTPYNTLKCSFNWYFIYDYCAGWIQSWGVHHCDIALWGAPALRASTLAVAGTATFPADGIANTSITWNVDFTTPGGLVYNFTDNRKNGQGCRFIGEKGWVHVRRGGITADPPGLLRTPIRPGDEHLYESGSHWGNFLACVRSRRDPVAPVEAGHRATTLSLVGDIATRLKRKLVWDWKTERFVDDEAANRMLGRPMRSPWTM